MNATTGKIGRRRERKKVEERRDIQDIEKRGREGGATQGAADLLHSKPNDALTSEPANQIG